MSMRMADGKEAKLAIEEKLRVARLRSTRSLLKTAAAKYGLQSLRP